MDIVHPRVAGIDVHKKVAWVAVRLPGDAPGERKVIIKRFKTFWRPLQKMAAWLAELGVTDAAMESTGVYWWPVYHALAGAGIEVCVCNAAHMRNVPGRKTDLKDCQWIAELHEYGLLRPSFIPAAEVAALRQRTRYRKRLIEQRTAESQRLAKVLEGAGIKIDSVASRLLGVSGREMIEALIAGERSPGRLADLARGVLRRKTDDLQMACDGRFTGGHGQMCRLHLDAYDHLTAKIAELDALVAEAVAPFAAVIARLMTIPGIGQRTAEVIVAETGGDMTRFATSARLAAWAGLAPGDNESAGKRKYAAARPGNRYLRAAMTESAWATARTRTRPGARFRRLARRFGKGHEKKAAIAVAHTLICIAWAVMARGQDYADAGEDYYDQRDQRNREHLIRHHQQAPARLGCQVTSVPPGYSSPPPDTASPHQARQPDASAPSPAALTAGSAGAAARPAGGPPVSLQRLSFCAASERSAFSSWGVQNRLIWRARTGAAVAG